MHRGGRRSWGVEVGQEPESYTPWNPKWSEHSVNTTSPIGKAKRIQKVFLEAALPSTSMIPGSVTIHLLDLSGKDPWWTPDPRKRSTLVRT